MTIKITCRCGKVLGSQERDAGLPGRCPNCGDQLVVPGTSPLAENHYHSRQGSLSSRRMRRIERWVFAQQIRLWLVAALVVPLLLAFFIWSNNEDRRRAQRDWRRPSPASGKEVGPDEALENYPQIGVPASQLYDLNTVPDAYPWSSNFDAFAQAVTKAIKEDRELKVEFTDHEIRWTVTFDTLASDNALYFQEAERYLRQHPAVEVWISLLPTEIHKASRLRRGDKVTIRGRVGHPTDARTPTHPLGIVRIAPQYCIIEQQ